MHAFQYCIILFILLHSEREKERERERKKRERESEIKTKKGEWECIEIIKQKRTEGRKEERKS